MQMLTSPVDIKVYTFLPQVYWGHCGGPLTRSDMLALRLLGRGTACSLKSGVIESELAVLQSSIVGSWRFKSTRTEKDTFGPLEVPGDK